MTISVNKMTDSELLEEFRIACEMLNIIGFNGHQFDLLHALEDEVSLRKLKSLPLSY